MPSMRFHVKIRDVPPTVAARTLGLTLEAFTQKLPELLLRRFPPADPTTGNYDLRAIDQWQDLRHAQLLPGDIPTLGAADASLDIRERLRNLKREPAKPRAPRVSDQEKAALFVTDRPITAPEKFALEGYYKARGKPIPFRGASADTSARLEASGFVSTDAIRAKFFITPAGEAEWRRIASGSD